MRSLAYRLCRRTQSEIWRDVAGYEGFYQVSDQGRVRSLDRAVRTKGGATRRHLGRVLSPHIQNHGGYHIVVFCSEGERQSHRVHVLVAAAFIGPRPAGQHVRHLDNNPNNNGLRNLAYGTPKENVHDTIRQGRHRNQKKTHCKLNHQLVEANLRVRPDKPSHWRECSACHKARSSAWYIRRRGEMPDFRAIADQYYAAIMSPQATAS